MERIGQFQMHPLAKADFFHVPGKSRNTKKVKSFTDLQLEEMKAFTKKLREAGRYYSYIVEDGNDDVPIGGEQLDLLASNVGRNRLHIIKYI